MQHTRSLIGGCLLSLAAFAAACGGGNAERSQSGEWAEAEAEPRPWTEAEPMRSTWLDRIAEGDVLAYAEPNGENGFELRVTRLARRGEGVAVQLVPTTAPPSLDIGALWLAGDSTALHVFVDRRVDGAVPLDDRGRVVHFEQMPDGLESWDGELSRATFTVDQLDMAVDRPRPDDECAWITKEEQVRTQLLVCASLGVVQIRTGPEESASADWRLTEVRHAGR